MEFVARQVEFRKLKNSGLENILASLDYALEIEKCQLDYISAL